MGPAFSRAFRIYGLLGCPKLWKPGSSLAVRFA